MKNLEKPTESAAADVPLSSCIALINCPGSQFSVAFANTRVKMAPSSVIITGAGSQAATSSIRLRTVRSRDQWLYQLHDACNGFSQLSLKHWLSLFKLQVYLVGV
ncbi:UNVERIFIED_ORG: hypothetical protein C7430_11742 [Pantoea agglomerans]|uniref:Uncharacterized protein n=1 Tax=Enterobacter agglomerans TaxID=549 RepID=A0ABD6XL45_ENTAG